MAVHAGVRGPGHVSRNPGKPGTGGGGGGGGAPALKFNANTNSQYIPVIGV